MNETTYFALSMLMPVVITLLFTVLERFTFFGRMKKMPQQLIIGIFFAAAAVFATEWGLETETSVISARDAVPICAAFAFNPFSGLFAAVAGAGYRIFSALFWKTGTFSAVACSLSTLLIGIAAAVIQRFFQVKKHLSVLFVIFFCVVAEGTHMLLIFLTHLSKTTEAYYVVSDCILPMMLCITLIVTASHIISVLISGNRRKTLRRSTGRSLSIVMERVLILSMIAAYVFTGVLTYIMQNNAALSRATDMLQSQLNNFQMQINKTTEQAINDTVVKIAYFSTGELKPLSEIGYYDIPDSNGDGYSDDDDISALLEKYCQNYSLSEIDLIDENKKVVYSSIPSMVGATINDAFFFNTLDTEAQYTEVTVPQGKTEATAGRLLTEGMNYFDEARYLRCLYTEQNLTDAIKTDLYLKPENFHFGSAGTILVLSGVPNENGEYEVVKSIVEDESDIPDSVSFFHPETNPPDKMCEVSYNDKAQFMIYKHENGLYYMTLWDKDTAMQGCNISVLVILLLLMDIFAFVCLIMYCGIRIHIIRNINTINSELGKICDGDLDVAVNVRNSSEFSELSDDINTTVSTLKHYIDAEASRIDKELEVAHGIQSAALPREFPNRPEFDMYADMVPAKEVGGDFYDFFFTGEDSLAFLIADVSGKGIPAALFMMTARTTLKSLALQGKPINEVFETANRELYDTNPSKMFVTAWMGLLNIKTGELKYVNAGHNPPLVYHDGFYEYLRGKTGFVLAGLKNMKYNYKTVTLSREDRILLYTDGVTEAKNKYGDFYGEFRLDELLNRCGKRRAKEICETVRADVDKFAEGCEPADDLTLLSICYHGCASPAVSEKEFDAVLQSTDEALSFVEQTLTSQGCSELVVNRFQICTDEVFSNIVKFSYPGKDGKARIRIEVSPDKTVLSFSDRGKPFNPLDYKNDEIELPAAKRKPGGLGIMLVSKLMDEVKYTYQNNENCLQLTLLKH